MFGTAERVRNGHHLELSTRQLCEQYIGYISSLQSKATVRNNRYVLGLFADWSDKPVAQLTNFELEDFFASCAGRLTPESLNTYKAIIRAFLNYLGKYRRFSLDLAPELIRNARTGDRKIHYYSVEEIGQMVSLLKTPQDKLILSLMYETGLRISEVVNLQVSQVKGQRLNVRGKGAKDRPVFISRGLSVMLTKHLLERKISTGTVFRHEVPKASSPNTGFSVQGLRLRLQRQLTPHGIKFKPHWVRHTFGTEIYNNGADIRSVQELMGHARIDTTMLYTHVSEPHRQQVHDKYLPKLKAYDYH